MNKTTTKLATSVEEYFTDLRRIRSTGGGTGERSSYGPLANLLNAVGKTLKPKVFCVGELADQGAGHPDFGLYTAKQVQKGRPRQGQNPERGVVEVKPPKGELGADRVQDQVVRYLNRYGLVVSTNFREFELVGVEASGGEMVLESFILVGSEEEFWRKLDKPRAFANEVSAGLSEFLIRALSHQAAISEPKDLAWLLASYARDALGRVEIADDPKSLEAIRSALEESLGVHFKEKRGARFFHSTLVQTLFYGIFSAWVIWARKKPATGSTFNWHDAVWHLRTSIMQALFQQISQPGRLQPLGLVEVMDRTSAALDRVDRDAFFAQFDEGEAVTYFYEPFLEAFDPELRKELGVWYTPSEVVRYMVARVDKALKDDLGIADGLAAENVYVLDPCCGTGAYLSEVLRRIAANLEGRGLGALTGAEVKKAAMDRVFGFEIMPAPFVVAHLQIDLALRDLGVALSDDGTERASVYLTNALTDWEGTSEGSQTVAFHELQEERDRAGRVKQKIPILVILGNPPYNGFAGMAVDEERDLSHAYRDTWRVRRPEGQGLNDLYVRFFRMAERKIAITGQGVVCFISNYSWLDGLSFTGMRERYLETFDTIHIDCLNGDKYKTGKVAPDGSPDPSIFSTEADPVGIQVGTAITTLVRNSEHAPAKWIGFRHLWGKTKPNELIDTAEANPETLYDRIEPVLGLGLPFYPLAVSEDWFDWPTLPDLFPVSFPGVKTSRDPFLVDIDPTRLQARVNDYFDVARGHDEIAAHSHVVMKSTARFDARKVRETLLRRGGPIETGFVRFAYRPFDIRSLYWDSDGGLLDRPRADYRPHLFVDNIWLVAQRKPRRDWSPPQVITHIGCLDLIDRGATCIPAYLRYDEKETNTKQPVWNLGIEAANYLRCLSANVEDLLHHVVATLHDRAYREANAGALRMEWPRIPLPGWPDGKAEGAAHALAESAARGRELARLLDPDAHVPGLTEGTRSEFKAIAVPSTVEGNSMSGDDFVLAAGWGHYGSGEAVMPGQGRIEQRRYTAEEIHALGAAKSVLGNSTFDIYLNDNAFWRNIPAAVWNYKLGGYQVLKKWLSYREHKVLGRALKPDEVGYFANVARRIAGILMLTHRSEK